MKSRWRIWAAKNKIAHQSGLNAERQNMIHRTEKSLKLYEILLERGYPERFCCEITCNLNTDWTAQRMIGYLSHYGKLPMEDVADEMLAILSDRERIMQKKQLEEANDKWNRYRWNGFE